MLVRLLVSLLALTLIIIPTGATQDSTAIFFDLCFALFSNDLARFLIMLFVIPFFVCLLVISFFYEIPQSTTIAAEKEETRYFAIFSIVAVIVVVYLLAYSLIELELAWSGSKLTWSDSNRYWKRETTSTAEERKVIIEKTKVVAFATAEEATTLVEKFKDTG
ncbi:hypothetical protein Golob_008223 [Gossypium lobatum]|uniref:Nodulin-like domain-containing protein n=1 Tax=Gossypium lobatum TaxID=34289 RepID=A0A7J8MET9_9ROSI|nr:hypothetical protein [Gossypium lobatum]